MSTLLPGLYLNSLCKALSNLLQHEVCASPMGTLDLVLTQILGCVESCALQLLLARH